MQRSWEVCPIRRSRRLIRFCSTNFVISSKLEVFGMTCLSSRKAYLISLHGHESDQKVLEARLERWRKDWADRSVEAETNLQGTVERELVYGLIHAKSWKLPPERVKELQQSCITKYCRQNF